MLKASLSLHSLQILTSVQWEQTTVTCLQHVRILTAASTAYVIQASLVMEEKEIAGVSSKHQDFHQMHSS